MLLSYKPDRETLMYIVLLKYVLKPGHAAELVRCWPCTQPHPGVSPFPPELGMAVSEMFLEKAAPSGAQGHSWLQRVQGQETPSHPLKAEKRK